jgi:hypothetical protein
MVPTVVARLAVLVAAIAAMLVPVASSASAGPAPKCWTEADVYETNMTVHATAYKDCTNDDPPVNLYVELQSMICDQYGCLWVKETSGYGHTSYTCKGTYLEMLRSSRLPSEIIYCYPV